MNKILRILKDDLAHIHGNVIALVVCVGMIVVPSFYAWINIAGFWDPYGNTANLRVAVANSDEGYKSDIMPVEINIGERTVSDLRESKSIGYEVTDEDEARDGVASGKYYAAIIIPKDFSRSMLTNLFSGDPDDRPTVEFVNNEKRNAIANIVTNKASTSVSQSIDETFVSTAVEVAAGTLDEIGNYLDDDQMVTVATNLSDALADATDELRRTATNLRSYASLVDSVNKLADDADGTLRDTLDATDGMGDTLRKSSSGVRDIDSALGSATSSLDDAFSRAAGSYDGVRGAVNQAFDTAGGATDKLGDGLQKAKDAVDRQDDLLKDLLSSLDQTLADTGRADTAKVSDHGTSIDVGDANLGAQASYNHTVYITVSGLRDAVSNAEGHAKSLSDGLQQTIDDLNKGKTDAESARKKLSNLIDGASSSLSSINTDYEGGLGSSLRRLSSGIDDAANTADSLLTQLDDTSKQASDAISDSTTGLADLRDSLNEAADKLDTAADDIDDSKTSVADALSSGDLAQVRQILSADPISLAEFISEPIQLNRNAVFPIANNGSAMAPYMTSLSIWIGAVILCALVKANPTEEEIERVGAKPRHAYLGRILFFVIIGQFQTFVIVGGNLFYLGIQAVHPWLLLLCCMVASLSFVNIVFALTASFGDVGKAIAVVLMVLQVAGSGGSFPMEMLPKAFQTLYPFLPFVHAETCMRAAMCGLYGLDYWISLAKLASFIVPSLILGLLLRKPVVRLNEWFEHQLERAKVM